MEIPVLDIRALFGPSSAARIDVDAQVLHGAGENGFLIVTGLPADIPLGAGVRREMLRVFELPDREMRRLWRRKFAPHNRNVYRGWFPLQPGNLTSKEGIDLGADVAHGPDVTDSSDPLREPTPLPAEALLPGWRQAVSAYYLAMERVAGVLMRSIARGLGRGEDTFDAAFHRGLSTLRLLRYPLRSAAELASCKDPQLWVDDDRHVVGAAHTDSGFMTLLAQDGVPGLQARAADGSWTEVPPIEDSLVVNFGHVLEAWSDGRIRATEHRVLGSGQVRHSVPFFYEARAEAEIGPLPGTRHLFEPFLYGDYLWARITEFVEFRGMAGERPPRRPRQPVLPDS
ncbi:MAG: isopenicillin N synthase family oxygenase [Proteobacteria bacterium]|nr:isopenicillin N synthase family oxygenase [Pseudomonadota bacterium]